MHIGVISDTHGHVPLTLEGLRLLREFELDAVIHCGDIGTTDVVELFDEWPTHFVFGNVDRQPDELAATIKRVGQTCHGRWGRLELGGARISFLHGDDTRLLNQVRLSGEWDLVCYGHTHQQSCKRVGGTVILNPGAVYRASPRSVAVVELPACQVVHLTW